MTAVRTPDLETLRGRRSEKWRTYAPDVLPAWVAEMDFDLCEPVQEALLQAVRAGDTGYSMPGALPEVFARFAAERWGWEVDPGRVNRAPDVMTGVATCLRLLTEPGDGVMINPPVYPPFFTTIRHCGRSVVEVPWFDLPALETAFAAGARAYLLCSPHNPTGRVLTAAELGEIARLAARHDVTVVADEIHGPLTLPGSRFVPYGSVAGSGRWVVLTGASKAWNLAGLKCALLVAGSDDVQGSLAALPSEVRDAAGHLGVIAAEAAFRDGVAWLDALLAQLDENRRLLGDLLARELPAVRWTPPQATYLAWLDCRELGFGDDPAAAFLEGGRVALSSGPAFGTQGAGFARLNLGTSTELLTEAVRRMALSR